LDATLVSRWDLIERKSVEVFELQANGHAAGGFGYVNHFDDFAVTQRARRFDEDGLAVGGPPVQRNVQPAIEVLKRSRRLPVQQIAAFALNGYDKGEVVFAGSG
jgi:hypothetical protein